MKKINNKKDPAFMEAALCYYEEYKTMLDLQTVGLTSFVLVNGATETVKQGEYHSSGANVLYHQLHKTFSLLHGWGNSQGTEMM